MFRGRSTLIYLVLALGLFCYLTFVDKKYQGTEDRAKAQLHLLTFAPDDVTGLEITNLHGTFNFQKKGDHWEITSPVSTLADSATMSEIIGMIDDAQPQRTMEMKGSDQENEKNLREWGLLPAADKAVVHLKDRSVELLIGRKVAINSSTYARTSEHRDAPVSIIPITVKDALEKNLSDFRSRNVFDFEPEKVTRVAASVANTPTTPAQESEVDYKNGRWSMQKPLVARASAADVLTLLQHVLGLRVTDFVTDEPGNSSKYGLTTPSTTLSVTVGADDEGILQIGSPVPGKTGEVYAQRVKSNAIFTLQQSNIAEIVQLLANVRDRHVLPIDRAAVSGISFDIAGPKPVKADLRRDKNGVWQVVGASAGTADVGRVTDVISRLSDLMTTPAIKDSAPDLKPFGLDAPTGKITLASSNDKESISLLIGKTENNLTYVRNSIEPFIYTVPADAFAFLGDNLSYRDKRAVTLDATKVKGLTITAQDRPPLVLERSEGGTWTATNAKDRQVDATKADSQVSILCNLQAQTWLGAPKPEYALDRPVLRFTLQSTAPAPTIINIGAPLPDGTHAAQVQGQPDAFALSEGDFGLLNASSLQMIPGEVPATNAAPAAAVTNAAPAAATNAPPATPAKPAPPAKKKKKKSH